MSRWSTLVLTTVSVLALTSATVGATDARPGGDDRSPTVAPQLKMRGDSQWCC